MKAILTILLVLAFVVGIIPQNSLGQEKKKEGDKVKRTMQATFNKEKVLSNQQITPLINENTETIQIPEIPGFAPTATRTASVSGNWNNTATWGNNPVPTASDAVVVNTNITVTIDIANAQCLSLTMNRPSTGQTNTLNINANTLTCGSLTMSATTTSRNNIINITTGTLTVTGALTTGTTGCRIIFTNTGTLNLNGNRGTSNPTIVAVAGSTVNIGLGNLSSNQFTAMTLPIGSNLNYTGASAQTVYAATYLGNLGFSGAGTKTIAASTAVTINGSLNNNSTLVLAAGSNLYSTWLVMGGNVTNTGTITSTGDYTRFIFSSANAQTFTNNGTVTAPMASFDVSNTNASGLTLSGSNNIVVTRANLFAGNVTNSNKLTFGTGGSSYAVVQRGVAANTSPAGSFDVAPTFNVGSEGLVLLYDNGSVAYNTGFEVPSSSTCDLFYIFDAADVSLSSNLTVTSELNFYGGTGTPTLRIGAKTLTLGGAITYTVAGAFYGGVSSNLIMNGSTTLNAVTNGLNNLTINNSGGVTLGGAATVNGTLSLNDGALMNGAYLNMANGSTISRTSTGMLSSAPSFGTSVNVVYTGSSAINTGYEIPTTSTILNNMTTNAGGVTQSAISSGGTVSTIYTQGFNGAPADWTTEIVTNTGTYSDPIITYVTTGVNPTVAPTDGTQCIEFNSYDCDPGDQIRLKKNSSPVSTIGKTNITVIFDWYIYTGTYSGADQVTVQWSIDGSTWNNSSSYARTGNPNSWVTNSCILPSGAENQASLYVAFLFTSGFGYNCHLDNMKINVTTPGSPLPSTTTVNGSLNLTGNYVIGSGNTLSINGAVSGAGTLSGSTTSNVCIGGTGATGTLNFTPGSQVLNNLTLDNTSGISIPISSNLAVGNTLTLTNGNIDMGSNTLTLGTDISNTGTLNPATPSDASYIIGNFERWIPNSTTSDIYFPLGSSGQYRLAIINFTSAPSGGRLKVCGYEGNPGSTNTTNIKESGTGYIIDRYSQEAWWSMTTSDLTGGVYNISLQPNQISGVHATNFPLLRILKRTINTADWTLAGAHSNATGGYTQPLVKRTGLSGFSEFGIGGNYGDGNILSDAPLPVQLSSFTSSPRGRNINLDWVTASEINNAGFNVERAGIRHQATDNWERIGFVNGKGTVNTTTKYTFEDKNLQTGKYKYRLKQIDNNGNFEYFALNGEVEVGVPNKFNITQNYPNPFNPTTKIDFDLPLNSKVNIVLYDISGREVKTLVNEVRAAGYYTIQFNATDLSSGTYFYRIVADKFVMSKKMVLLK